MNLIQWKPLSGLSSFFDDSLNTSFPMLQTDLTIDVYEKKHNVVAEMSLPGVQEDDIDISIEDELLTISGQREEEKETNGKNYYSKEIKRGSFTRTVRLPRMIDAAKAEASYKADVLKVMVPIVPGAKEKVVKVDLKK
jgi:HSP20 family protein